MDAKVVLRTWSGTLQGEDSLPPDWLSSPGLLVGMDPLLGAGSEGRVESYTARRGAGVRKRIQPFLYLDRGVQPHRSYAIGFGFI